MYTLTQQLPWGSETAPQGGDRHSPLVAVAPILLGMCGAACLLTVGGFSPLPAALASLMVAMGLVAASWVRTRLSTERSLFTASAQQQIEAAQCSNQEHCLRGLDGLCMKVLPVW